MKIHVEIYIAARLLAQNHPTFSPQDLINFIQREFGDERPGVRTHATAVCIANAPLHHPNSYNYLWRVSHGEMHLFQPSQDLPHPDRVNAPTQPQRADMPAKYLHLLRPE
ncbi:MAG TPA: hypothetical protein PKM01_11275 [Anaerolineaceae bacterium]|jgi:hypothetical protein|nr:hypothetical protein [Anaerolineaceae bacterium]HQF63804.1 hypothetical protein [Anaerolineaceae bacterium]HQH87163.1 hypothetical protein [Anaerolineaceae bacterium]